MVFVIVCPFLIFRKKIAAIVSSQSPTLDPQHPEILEEARYWCTVLQERVRRDKNKMKLEASVKVDASGQLWSKFLLTLLKSFVLIFFPGDTIAALTSSLPSPTTAPTGSVNLQALQQMAQTGQQAGG